MTSRLIPALASILLSLLCVASAAWAGPMYDFSKGTLYNLDTPTVNAGGVIIDAYYRKPTTTSAYLGGSLVDFWMSVAGDESYSPSLRAEALQFAAAESSFTGTEREGITLRRLDDFNTMAGDPYVQDMTVSLYRRNDPGDNGFGVCAPDETGDSSTSCAQNRGGVQFIYGDGDINELDNVGSEELIRLTRPVDEWWTEVWLSSVDGQEQGRIGWSNDDQPGNLSSLTWFLTYQAGVGVFAATVEAAVPVTGAAQSARYLYVQPLSGVLNNDHLVWGASTEEPVPEPSSLVLLGLGLAAMARVVRQRRARRG